MRFGELDDRGVVTLRVIRGCDEFEIEMIIEADVGVRGGPGKMSAWLNLETEGLLVRASAIKVPDRHADMIKSRARNKRLSRFRRLSSD